MIERRPTRQRNLGPRVSQRAETRQHKSLTERIGAIRLTRRQSIAVGEGALIAASQVDVPGLIEDIVFRIEFRDVWDELMAFLNPLTDEQMMGMVYNPTGSLLYTPEQLQNLLIICDGDSMNLPFGIRKNSLGPDQPESWIMRFADNLRSGADALGIETNVTTANLAQPGAAGGLVRYQYPEGNVQLGATTEAEMADDHKGEIPPVKQIIDFDGQVDAAIGMNGDHLRGALDMFLNYFTTDNEFRAFCEHPSKDKLTDHLKKVLKKVLKTYKECIQQFHDDFAQALNIYEYANDVRVNQLHKSPIRLLATLPINYKYSDSVPHQELADDGQRKSGGYISLSEYPNARSAAQRMTSSYYQTINPLLEDFHKRSGIEIHTLPMLDLSKNKRLFAKDGHLTPIGEGKVGDWATRKSRIIDNKGTALITFTEDGSYQKVA